MSDPSSAATHHEAEIAHNLSVLYSNVSWMLNASSAVGNSILNRFATNLKVDTPAFYSLIFAYSCLILLGSAGNLLVVFAVARKPAMRTARNMFMINLAISDLLLCQITMPLTLMEILTQYWPLGRQEFICKLLGTLQALSIFVSSFSITAIALDRYQVIVYPTRESLQKFGATAICVSIWCMAIVLASPMYVWRSLNHHNVSIPSINLEHVTYCVEDWPLDHGRAYYSLFSLCVQFILPIITVSVAYTRICRKLKYRYVSQTRKTKDDTRMKRTNSLLVSIAVIFFVSWIPLNVVNLVADLHNGSIDSNSMQFLISYSICHMIGMTSACSNPLLYGWLNDNFRKEFKEILALMIPCVKFDTVRERVGSIKSSLTKRKKKSNEFAASAVKDGESGCPLADGDEADRPAVSSYRGAVNNTMTTENGTGMMQGDTEMTELTRA